MEMNTPTSSTHASTARSSTSESGGNLPGDAGRRPAFAAQACETCRRRKTRCDERRPRCSFCERLDVACDYREPKPTKRDKTLGTILKSLENLEIKVDQLVSDPNNTNPASRRSTSRPFTVPARQSTDIQRILTWPQVRRLLQLDSSVLPHFAGIEENAEQWLVKISRRFEGEVPIDGRLDLKFTNNDAIEKTPGSITLTRTYVENLSSIYFQTFHAIYPILDVHSFVKTILPRVCSHSFQEEDEGSALVLLVLALGTLAYEGSTGDPIVDVNGNYATGIRGGTVSRPPGLELLNEGRRRMGLIVTNWSITSLQCFVLTAIYFSQCSRNLEYWRSTVLSCTLCQNLLKINTQWDTPESDQLSRCYWMCHLLEGGPTGELQVDSTGITASSGSIPLPHFQNSLILQPALGEMFSHLCFLAQVSLRSIIDHIIESQKSYRNIFDDGGDGEELLTSDYITEELLRQLTTWRQHLPSELVWDDEVAAKQAKDIVHNGGWQDASFKYSNDVPDMKSVLAAALQTRYKYAHYMLWRPYIYRFLHSQKALTGHDLQCCRKALNASSSLACLMWPITYPEFSRQRRLIPHLYEYSHSFFGILTLTHLCASKQAALYAPMEFEDPKMVYVSNGLLLHWIRDMKVVHPVANWCWPTLKNLYHDHSAVRG